MKFNFFTELKNCWQDPRRSLHAPQSLPDAVCLEDRVLFSAVPFEVPVESVDWSDADKLDQVSLNAELLEHLEVIQPDQPLTTISLIESLLQVEDSSHSLDASHESTSPTLVFVDQGVEHWDQLVTDLITDNSDIRVFLLSGDRDGVAQITQVLDDFKDVSSLHVISHGTAGQVNLGSGLLSLANIDQYEQQLASWRDHLSADADVLFYGCDLASSVDGETLLEKLADLTGADIAASNDLTGSASLGGDWNLEFTVGAVDTDLVFTPSSGISWFGVLASVPVTAYLDNDGEPIASTETVAPSGGLPVPDYDGDGQPGRTIEKDTGNYGESVSGKHQIWHSDLGGFLINGNVSVTIWAAMQSFDAKDGEFNVYLTETDQNGGSLLSSPLASVTIFTDELDWSGGFDMKVADFGSIYHFVEPGRRLAIQITVDDSGSDDKMIFAYDRASTPSRIEYVMETSGAPTISNLNGDVLNYTEDDGPLVIDQGLGASIADGDSTNFDGGLLYVSVAAGGSSGEDVLSVRNQGSGSGQIGFNGTDVSYEGTNIGTVTGGSSGDPLRISLNANADDVAVSALARNITYENANNGDPSTASRTINFFLHDGEGGVSANVNATVNVTAQNDAPLLDNLGSMTLTTIEVDDFSSPGNTIANIISSAGGNRITDPDGPSPEGIAVISVDDSNGTWEYSINGGSVWSSFTTDGVAPNSAVLLNSAALIRFVPSSGYFGTGGNIEFHAWDQTSGSNGDIGVNVAAQTGGTNAFSVDTETATIKVNDPPQTSDLPNQVMDEDDAPLNIDLFPHFSDSEDSDAQLTYNVVGNTNTGLFDATTIVSGQLLQLDLKADQFGSALISVRATDQDGWFVESSFTLTVNSVNDDPNITSSGTATIVENTTAVLTATSTDVDGGTPSYSITGGADQSLFSINSSTGELTFDVAPDFETPADANTDNVYEVEVTVDDGNLGTDAKTVNVTVVDAYILDEFNAFTYSGNDGTVNWSGDWIEADAGGPNGGDIIVLGSFELYIRTNQLGDEIYRVADLSSASAATLTYDTNNTLSGSAQVIAEVRTGTGIWTTLDTFDATNPGINSHTHDLSLFLAVDTQIRFRVAGQQNGAVILIDNVRIDFESVAAANTPPTITSNGGGDNASVNVAENTTAVTDVDATDTDLPADTLTYSISGGADAALFTINSTTGQLDFITAKDFETYEDANLDGTYEVQVTVDDGTDSDVQDIDAVVTDQNDAPIITSDGGGATATVNVAEGLTTVTDVNATDEDAPADTLTYSITGGADAAQFTINSTTGQLDFNAAKDFEAFEDADLDGTYEVQVTVDDGIASDIQDIDVVVTDQNDAPMITSDGGGDTAAVNVAEGSTAVTNIDASDEDVPADTLTYTISGGADAALFAINSSTGQLDFITAKDFETFEDANLDGIYDVQVTVDDGTDSDVQDINVTVTNVNEDPILSGIEGTNASYTENGAAIQITNTITIGDVDDTEIDFATIQITGNFTAGDELFFTDTATISHSWDGGTGTLTLTGPDDLADYVTALRNVGFANTGDDPTAATRTVSFTVNDGGADSNTLTRDIDVTPSNDAPVIIVDPINLSYSTGQVAVDPFLTVNDVDSAQLIGATVRLNAGFIASEDRLRFTDQNGISGSYNTTTGVLTLTGLADVSVYEAALRSVQYENINPTPTVGTLRVRFQVDDGTDTSAWDRRTIEIINDEPPRASDDSGTVMEGGSVLIDLAVNDSDNNDLLDLTSIVIQSGPSFGTLIDNLDGTLTYTHNGSETLSDSFTYTIKDNFTLESNVASVALTVTPVNDAPVINSDGGGATATVNVVEGTTSVTDVDAVDDDVPADTLTYNITGGADAGLFTINSATGQLDFLAPKDFETFEDADLNGIYEVQVTVDDGNGLNDVQDISVAITDTNDAPTATIIPSAYGVDEDDVPTILPGISIDDTDAGPNDVEVSLTVSNGVLALGSTTGLGFVGGANGTATMTVQGTVAEINASLTTLTYQPDLNWFGTDTITLTVDDLGNTGGPAETDMDTASIVVSAINDDPIITSDGGGSTAIINVAENSTGVTTVTSTDVEPDTPSYSITGGTDQLLFNINSSTGDLTFATGRDFETFTDANLDGIYEVQVTVDDGNLGTDVQDISVAVTDVNESPVITSHAGATTAFVNVTENTTAVTTITADDEDLPADTLTYSISGGADASLFTINSTTGEVTFLAPKDFENPTDANLDGDYEVEITVDDGNSNTDIQTIVATVVDGNETPTTTGIADLTVDEDSADRDIYLPASFLDSEDASDDLTFVVTGNTDPTLFDSVTINVVDDRIYFDFADDQHGISDITVRATDSGGLWVESTFRVTVNSINDDPIITSNGGGGSADIVVDENTAAVTTVVASDIDLPADTLTYNISGGADQAQFSINSSTGDLTFDTPKDFETRTDANLDGIYIVEVTVDDGNGGSDVQTINVTVDDVNEAPLITSDGGGAVAAINVAENSTAVTTVTASDEDTPGDTLSYTITGGTDAGMFTINSSTGQLDFIAPKDFETFEDANLDGVYEVQVTVDDGNLLTDSQVISVTVTDDNEAPVITSDGGGATASLTIAENTTAVTTVVAGDADAGDVLIYSLTGGADVAQFAINSSTGELTFISPKDFETPIDSGTDNNYEVVVTVDDGNGGIDSQSIDVSVIDANEKPTTSDISDVTVDEDAVDRSFNLHAAFADDEDADTDLTYTVESVTNGGLFNSSIIDPTDQLILDFADNQNGFSMITVRATDTGGLFEETTFRVDVNAVNDDPTVIASVAPVVVNEDAADTVIDISAVFDDVDIVTNADSLSYSLVSNSNAALVSSSFAGFNLSLDYADDQFGSANITLRATDTLGRSVDEIISVTVNPVQDPTIVSDDVATPTPGDPVTIDPNFLLANDFDSDSSSFVVNLDPGSEVGGMVTVDGTGNLIFTPYASFEGTASFRYVVVADGLTSSAATVFIDVLPAIPAPSTPDPTPDPDPDPGDDGDEDDVEEAVPPTVATNSNPTADELPGTTNRVVNDPVEVPLFELAESSSNESVGLNEVAATNFIMTTIDLQNNAEDARQFNGSSWGNLDFVTTAGWLWSDLDDLQRRLSAEGSISSFWSVTTPTLATSLSVGYVMWLIKGGQIMAGLMAQVPAWKLIAIDPLPILKSIEEDDGDEGDSLASMVDDASSVDSDENQVFQENDSLWNQG